MKPNQSKSTGPQVEPRVTAAPGPPPDTSAGEGAAPLMGEALMAEVRRMHAEGMNDGQIALVLKTNRAVISGVRRACGLGKSRTSRARSGGRSGRFVAELYLAGKDAVDICATRGHQHKTASPGCYFRQLLAGMRALDALRKERGL